ncbi:MAG: GIY-YIG nuclease family protein [Hyphomonadaceae bacterium]
MFFFGSHSWRGESKTRYRFKCVLTKKGLPENGTGGIYVFVRRRWAFLIEPLYVGKAADLRSRLLGHEKWPRAYWYYGATERYVMPVRDEIDRRRIEEDLIRSLKPRMNDMEIPQAKAAARAAPAPRRGLFARAA